jgi:tRNA (guanine37-N1)-methyltransferase
VQWHILTLFPEAISPYLSASIIGRGIQQGLLSVNLLNPRDFTTDPHKKVDDSPYGGGAGMVLTCQPMDDAILSLKPFVEGTRILLTSPAGRPFNHQDAIELAKSPAVIVLCGHYEGFDERIYELYPEIEEVSIGDYVLTGGELAALCIVDATSRMIPGVVQKQTSVEMDSFYDGLLDYPHYTRPAEYKGHSVPAVLLSGDHAKIAAWRKAQAEEKTLRVRPDLLS